jgi:hypothetical protein
LPLWGRRLALAGAFLLVAAAGPLLPSARAETASPTCEMWKPPAGSADDKVPVVEALQRIAAQHGYLVSQDRRERGYRHTTHAQVLQKYGLTDSQQAIVLGGTNWIAGGLYLWNVAGQMSEDFYKKNILPLERSEAALRGRNAPTHVPRADLDYMDDRMARLRAFEPTLQQLRLAALELDGPAAVLLIETLPDLEATMKMRTIFGINEPGPGVAIESAFGAEDSEAIRRLVEFLREPGREQRARALEEKGSALNAQKMALLEQYKAMQTQFTAEIGQRSSLPDCAEPPPIVPLPDDAIPD